VSATSRACRSGPWNSENGTTHGQPGSTAPQQTASQVSAWQAERRSRPTRQHPREDPRKETAFVEFKLEKEREREREREIRAVQQEASEGLYTINNMPCGHSPNKMNSPRVRLQLDKNRRELTEPFVRASFSFPNVH